MKNKMIFLTVLILLIFLQSTSISTEQTRSILIKKVANLSEWCESNNEFIAQSVLLTLKAALMMNSDTLLVQYTSEFSKQQINFIIKLQKEILKRKM